MAQTWHQQGLSSSRAGDAPFWLFLHTAGSTGGAFRGIARRLASHVTLLAPDLWRDNAEPPPAGVSLIDHDLAALLRTFTQQSSPRVVVGHGYGAVLALELARRHPAMVGQVVLIEPLALQLLGSDDCVAETVQLRAVIARVNALVTEGAQLEAARLLSSYWDESAWAKLPEPARQQLASAMPKVARSFDDLAALASSLADYQRLQVPTTLVRGARSPAPVRAIASQLARAIPDALLFEVAGAGHGSLTSHPDELALLLRRALLHTDTGVMRRPWP